jgi:hypothetical protein
MMAMVVGVIIYPTTLTIEPEVVEFDTHYKCPLPTWTKKEEPKEEEIVSIDKEQLRELIREVLVEIDLHSDSAEELLMMTAATESHLGKYIKQVGNVPNGGLGIFQMERATEEDIWSNYLAYRSELSDKVVDVVGGGGLSKFELKANLTYQIVMARIHYLRVKARLPAADDVGGMAHYWKKHYNSRLGKGTVEKAVESYNHYVAA